MLTQTPFLFGRLLFSGLMSGLIWQIEEAQRGVSSPGYYWGILSGFVLLLTLDVIQLSTICTSLARYPTWRTKRINAEWTPIERWGGGLDRWANFDGCQVKESDAADIQSNWFSVWKAASIAFG